MKGFSLIELLVTVALLGILSAIAIPTYNGYIDNTRVTNAQNNLRAIYLKQQEYYTNNNAYYSTGAACGDYAASINTNLFGGQNIIDDTHYTYCITQATADDFTAQADEAAGSRLFTLDQDNADNF